MKKAFIALAITLGFAASSCLGPNKAFEGLRDWNEGVSENKWVNEGIFLGLHIIPVYGIVYLADIIIFNSIEWWGGDNPMDD
jgi:hypothetical protein